MSRNSYNLILMKSNTDDFIVIVATLYMAVIYVSLYVRSYSKALLGSGS